MTSIATSDQRAARDRTLPHLKLFCFIAFTTVSAAISSMAQAAENVARAFADAIAICAQFPETMAVVSGSAEDLNWRVLTNADYGEWAEFIHEIEWVFLTSHDPFSRRDANLEAMLSMGPAIASNHKQASQYIQGADPSEPFGDPTRRLFANPLNKNTMLVVLHPGDYGAHSTCMVVSDEAPSDEFLGLFPDLRKLPPQNPIMTTAHVQGRVIRPTPLEPGQITVFREFDPQRLGAFTDYQMHIRHSFEVRVYERQGDN